MANFTARKGSNDNVAMFNKVLEYNRTHYGKVIRERRTSLGLSQMQLAKLINVQKAYIANWENGRARPDLNIIPPLCRALKMPIAAIFGISSEADTLAPDIRDHIQSYIALTARDRAAVNTLTEGLLQMEEREMQDRCRNGFVYLLHNENLAAAGTFNDLSEGNGEYEYIRRSSATELADEIITVTGDSMEPTYHPGDDLLVQHASTLGYGEIGILVINGEGFVKEYRGDGVYSHNEEKYPFRPFLPDDDIKIVGRVLGKVTMDQRPTPEELIVLEEIKR